jgi:hypothetical protein
LTPPTVFFLFSLLADSCFLFFVAQLEKKEEGEDKKRKKKVKNRPLTSDF